MNLLKQLLCRWHLYRCHRDSSLQSFITLKYGPFPWTAEPNSRERYANNILWFDQQPPELIYLIYKNFYKKSIIASLLTPNDQRQIIVLLSVNLTRDDRKFIELILTSISEYEYLKS